MSRDRQEYRTAASGRAILRPGVTQARTERLDGAFRGTQVTDGDASNGRGFVSLRHRLVVVSGPNRGLVRDVVAVRVVIGTAPSCDLVLDDATVSRRHCEISAKDDGYAVRDLGSTNATVLNGVPVVEAPIFPEARLRLGQTEIVFEPRKKWQRLVESEANAFGELVGASAEIRGVFDLLAKLAPTELSCVLMGETGTGKELAARALHRASARAEMPLVVLDCAGLADTLAEAELFGHEKGAFTGADRARAGAFERANGGTLFLDEIGELSPALQKNLLRALEQRQIKRLGAGEYLDVNVRVLAATHRDLAELTARGAFRDDLFYRLAEVVVHLPPLRDRPEDIALIARSVLASLASGPAVPALDSGALELLEAYPWPGNGRELRNVLRSAAALATTPTITAADVRAVGLAGSHRGARASEPPHPSARSEELGKLSLKEARARVVEPFERDYVARLIEEHDGDLDAAAKKAGIHRKHLLRLMKEHGLSRRRRK